MAVITISRGSYSRGREVAEATAQRLGFKCVSREALLRESKEFNISEIKLIDVFEDVPSILDRFTRGREKYVAYIKAALLRHLRDDNVVYHGFAGHFFVRDMPHVLKLRIISDMEDRVKNMMERNDISSKQARRRLKKIDDQRRKWARKLYNIDPLDAGLYDMVINVKKIPFEAAVDTICAMAGLEQFQTTPESARLMQDATLAAEVKTFLVEAKTNIQVWAENGMVYVKTDHPVKTDSEIMDRMVDAKKGIPGIKGMELVTGRRPRERKAGRSESGARSTRDTATTFFSDL